MVEPGAHAPPTQPPSRLGSPGTPLHAGMLWRGDSSAAFPSRSTLHRSGNSTHFLPKSNLAAAALPQPGHEFLGLSLSVKHLETSLA